MFFPTTFNPLSANPTKWSNTFKQFDGNSPLGLVLEGLSASKFYQRHLGIVAKFCGNLSELIKFYFPGNHWKTICFLMLLRGIEIN